MADDNKLILEDETILAALRTFAEMLTPKIVEKIGDPEYADTFQTVLSLSNSEVLFPYLANMLGQYFNGLLEQERLRVINSKHAPVHVHNYHPNARLEIA